MPIISRKTQKIFAQNATNNGQFGSAQLGTKVLSSDLATLQNLTAFTSGWNSATMSAKKLPTLEEMQALHYITTSQIAYLFQEGIAEYDSGTEYRINSLVKKSGTTEIYKSLTDANTGNALTDNTKWRLTLDLSNSNLSALAGLTGASNKLFYFTGAGAMAVRDLFATTTTQGIAYLSNPITISNNATTPNTDIDFTAGVFQFSDGSGQVVSTAMTKRLQSSGSWSAGTAGNMLLTGARANSSTYHLFAIYNPTTGVSDYGALLGVAGTAPDPTSVLPSGYTKFKRIASVITDGSGNIRNASFTFFIGGYYCNYNTAIDDAISVALTTTKVPLSLTTPKGIATLANVHPYFDITNGRDTVVIYEGGTSKPYFYVRGGATTIANAQVGANNGVKTNLSSQIDWKTTTYPLATSLITNGYTDYTN